MVRTSLTICNSIMLSDECYSLVLYLNTIIVVIIYPPPPVAWRWSDFPVFCFAAMWSLHAVRTHGRLARKKGNRAPNAEGRRGVYNLCHSVGCISGSTTCRSCPFVNGLHEITSLDSILCHCCHYSIQSDHFNCTITLKSNVAHL